MATDRRLPVGHLLRAAALGQVGGSELSRRLRAELRRRHRPGQLRWNQRKKKLWIWVSSLSCYKDWSVAQLLLLLKIRLWTQLKLEREVGQNSRFSASCPGYESLKTCQIFLAHSPEDRSFSYQVNGTQSNLKVNISTFTPGSCLDGFQQKKNESGLIPNSAFLKLKHTCDCSISTSKQNWTR